MTIRVIVVGARSARQGTSPFVAADELAYDATRGQTASLVKNFNATTSCEKVTCLYNDVNWWIERLIENPEQLEQLAVSGDGAPDYFL